jgi:hypothetical protein
MFFKGCKAAKIGIMLFHDFRHTAVSFQIAPVAQWIEHWIPNATGEHPDFTVFFSLFLVSFGIICKLLALTGTIWYQQLQLIYPPELHLHPKFS